MGSSLLTSDHPTPSVRPGGNPVIDSLCEAIAVSALGEPREMV